MSKRIFLPCAAALLMGAMAARAQTAPAQSGSDLPPGVVRNGNVITMQPIIDSDTGAPGDAASSGGEYHEGAYRVLSAADHDLFRHAFDAMKHGDWNAARGFAAVGQDPVARKLVQWRYLLDKDSGAAFADIDAFASANPNWPQHDTLLARAEAALDPAMSPSATIAWFGGRQPVSAIGKIRLGDALISTGRVTAGRDMVRDAWINNSFEPDQELAIVQRDGAFLTPEVDRQRLDSLLWRDDTAGARREMARVTDNTQRIAEARLALRTSAAAGARAVAQLPSSLSDDPSLLFERARTERRAGDNSQAEALLLRATTPELAKSHPDRLWGEVNIEARQAVQDGQYSTAYNLVSDTELSLGNAFAEAEFMAGWIALRYLKNPKAAMPHFKKLETGVSRPISLARAHYWEGRAREEAGDLAGAWQQYHLAAQDPETFYGQVALARIEPAPALHVRDTPVEAAPSRADFEKGELVRALRVLADLGEVDLLRIFALHVEELHPDAPHVKLLAQDLVEMGYREVALRVAKIASYGDIMLLPYTHPVIALPAYAGPQSALEPALVLGLIRQETEFDPDAVSSAGARGIMQIMPSTARHTAGMAGIPYRPDALTGDADYNIRLGMAEFADKLNDWGGSLILATAAYNAGSANVKRWVVASGDPRNPGVDPIDWIELIPFSETRNYVQRVLENMQIYRNRLAGKDQPLHILADLYRPNPPAMMVLSYTPPLPPATVPVPAPKPGPG